MTSDKPASLGRGLSALIPDAPRPGGSEPDGGRTIAVDRLTPGRLQPRRQFDEEALEALAQSIRDRGVLQPILARPAAGEEGRYEIVAGERRWRAAARAGLREVPVTVRALDDRAALEAALAENIQRNALSPIEEAEGYRRLQAEFGCTQARLSRAVGRSRPHIANMLRLLSLPGEVRDMLDAGRLSAGHGRALLSAPDPAGLAKRVLREGLSVRRVEAILSAPAGRRGRAAQPAAARDADELALEQELGDLLGLKVSLAHKGAAGRLTLHYGSLEQLDDLLDRLRR